jgi:uncharacterized membrane protein
MPPLLLALCSSVLFGASDFVGGWASRRNSTLFTLLVSQIASVIGLGILCLWLGGQPEHSDFFWGMVGGAGLMGGLGLLYYALAHGRMSEVAPVASVCAISISLVFDPVRLQAVGYLGVACAAAAVTLIAQGQAGQVGTSRRLLPILIGGLGGCSFGSFYVCLQHCHASAGFWPLLAAQSTSFALVAGYAMVLLARRVPVFAQNQGWQLSILPGILVVVGNICLLLALQHTASLAVVVTLVALYPVTTVLLAMAILKEKLRPIQGIGLVAAALAIILIAGFAKAH